MTTTSTLLANTPYTLVLTTIHGDGSKTEGLVWPLSIGTYRISLIANTDSSI